MVKPSERGAAILVCTTHWQKGKAGSSTATGQLEGEKAAKMQKTADELWSHRGESLVVSGSNNLGEQVLRSMRSTICSAAMEAHH